MLENNIWVDQLVGEEYELTLQHRILRKAIGNMIVVDVADNKNYGRMK